jgi:PAS domain S-box-containing protein
MLGVSVYLLNHKSSLNRLFMFMMLFNGYWAFCTYMKTVSDSTATALFWGKVLSFWPFLIAVMLHFALAFTENDLLRKKTTYVAMYAPALMFSLLDLTTDYITGNPILKPWGYSNSIAYSFFSQLDGVWAAVIGFIVIFVFLRYYTKVSSVTRKNQTKYVTAGLAVPIMLSVITDSLLPFAGVDLPILGAISGSITAIFIAYAILRYELFSLSPEIAAENIFSTMPDSVMLVSLDKKIVKVNRALQELTGYSEAEIIGRPIAELITKANILSKDGTAPQLIDRLQRVREVENYEISFYTKSGEKLTGTLSCSIVTNNHGQDVGAAFVFHDLTERKAMEQKLLRAERLASIGELAAILGHDLRNPLSGIRYASYYLKKKHDDHLDPDDLAMFESIDKSIEYSNKIINDLLDYSNEIKPEFIIATPKSLIATCLSAVPAPTNVEVSDLSADEPTFMVDADKICRCFINVIKNAFEAMSSGGKLEIKSGVDEDSESVVFTFLDTGHGISQEMLSNIWSPLRTTKARGMGFGLAICKRIVKAHGGKITIESSVGFGTTVTVRLPLNQLTSP